MRIKIRENLQIASLNSKIHCFYHKKGTVFLMFYAQVASILQQC